MSALVSINVIPTSMESIFNSLSTPQNKANLLKEKQYKQLNKGGPFPFLHPDCAAALHAAIYVRTIRKKLLREKWLQYYKLLPSSWLFKVRFRCGIIDTQHFWPTKKPTIASILYGTSCTLAFLRSFPHLPFVSDAEAKASERTRKYIKLCLLHRITTDLILWHGQLG